MPVRTMAVSLTPVAQSSDYEATIKSRRSATLQPQVDGRLTAINVRSGDHVKAGDKLMEIESPCRAAKAARPIATDSVLVAPAPAPTARE